MSDEVLLPYCYFLSENSFSLTMARITNSKHVTKNSKCNKSLQVITSSPCCLPKFSGSIIGLLPNRRAWVFLCHTIRLTYLSLDNVSREKVSHPKDSGILDFLNGYLIKLSIMMRHVSALFLNILLNIAFVLSKTH